MDVYLTKSPGNYVLALSLLGSSTPQVRSKASASKEIIATDYHVSREPLYSIYQLNGQTYELKHFEFCDGVILEACQPQIIEPLDSDSGLAVKPDTVIRERPNPSARPITIGGGDSGDATNTDPTIVGVLAKGDWYLVNAWKGSGGFVPKSAVRR